MGKVNFKLNLRTRTVLTQSAYALYLFVLARTSVYVHVPVGARGYKWSVIYKLSVCMTSSQRSKQNPQISYAKASQHS